MALICVSVRAQPIPAAVDVDSPADKQNPAAIQSFQLPSHGSELNALIYIAAAKPIQGDLYGSGSKGVILTHGGGRTKESWSKQATALTDAGFVVLAINFRSDTTDKMGRPITVGSDEDNAVDIRAAASYLRAHGVQNVSAVGASMGGYALAEADAKSNPGEFDRIVLLAASAEDGAALKGRKLFVFARGDVGSSGNRISEMTDSYAKAPRPKELLILDGSAHGRYLFDTDQGPRLMKEILRFLTEP